MRRATVLTTTRIRARAVNVAVPATYSKTVTDSRRVGGLAGEAVTNSGNTTDPTVIALGASLPTSLAPGQKQEQTSSLAPPPTQQTQNSSQYHVMQLQPVSAQPVPFLETVVGDVTSLPFKIPEESWFRHRVGNTPMVETEPNLFAKLEGANFSGSIKDRMILAMILSMFRDGRLKDGSTITLTTSGSAGKSLALVQRTLWQECGIRLNCIIAMPKAYAKKKVIRELLASGLPTFYEEPGPLEGTQLLFKDKIFMDVLNDMTKLSEENGWEVLDQHHDYNGMLAHKSTALELIRQVPDATDVVCATGTGATAAGLRKFLPSSVTVHSRPSASGAIDGLSDVNRYDNYCDTKLLQGYEEGMFPREDAEKFQGHLEREYDITAGLSSGATAWLAKNVRPDEREDGSAKVVFISADGQAKSLKARKPRRNPVRARRVSSTRSSTRAAKAFSQHRKFSTSAAAVEQRDHIVVGGGPVGASTAMFLSEHEAEQENPKRVLLVHDPKDRGAHEDWSRLARLSFDGPREEYDLSKHACELLDLVDEVRSNMSGAPVVPLRPGMLFVASPGSNLARTCANGASYGDADFVRRSPDELADLYPGNYFDLPKDTECWTHPTGYCVSPIELADTLLGMARAYGTEVVQSRAQIEMGDEGRIRVTTSDGQIFETERAYLMAGAQGKQILAESKSFPHIPELDQTYITGISTVRYKHVNHPADPTPGSGHVVPPIILGQLDVPDLASFQTNFSVVPEEMGDVYKTRLSGAAGQEVIETVAGLHSEQMQSKDAEIAQLYGALFGRLFPHLETKKALDFNRCVTYRNHLPVFSGTSLLAAQPSARSKLLITPGCFGVGVKFGPALGQAAAQYSRGDKLETGMNVFESGQIDFDQEGEFIERAW